MGGAGGQRIATDTLVPRNRVPTRRMSTVGRGSLGAAQHVAALPVQQVVMPAVSTLLLLIERLTPFQHDSIAYVRTALYLTDIYTCQTRRAFSSSVSFIGIDWDMMTASNSPNQRIRDEGESDGFFSQTWPREAWA